MTGTVQGVGFRPFVYRLALDHGIAGSVRNFSGGVEILAQGAPGDVDRFVRRLRDDAPPLARIRELAVTDLALSGETAFRIETTGAAGGLDVDAARDIATCDACLAEMRDPSGRRYRHPFINCTDCGPRYTIIESLPYDRPNTSMKVFPMCPACEREYNDPADRRFHAQPVCCHDCGPALKLLDTDGTPLCSGDPVTDVADALAGGRIVAVKGIGGFHLACDARSPDAVTRLRERKYREEKPLAVMVRDVDAARAIAELGASERLLLEGPERPIVLLAKRGEGGCIAREVAPRSKFLGLMLPYTPVHHMLLERLPYLVMTSGNKTEEPIARTNEAALEKLRGIADVFLVHDRAILTRNDDSVVREIARGAVIIRRSRGYVPEPIAAGEGVGGIIACGPMLKNCIAVGRNDLAYVSQHIGDLTNLETYRSLEQTAEKLCGMLGIEPELAACDAHPGYASTRFAESLGLPVVRVQHHHAHIVACMAENDLRGRVIGIAFDGTGYGDDGHTWGSEILIADRAGYERFGHLSYMKMPGGDAAVEHPGRMALGALFPLLGRDAANLLPWMDEADHRKRSVDAVIEMIERGVNTPLTCGMGRLFDAASALLGVCTRRTYEGQPAIELEGVADPEAAGSYPIQLIERGGQLEVDGAAILAAICEDRDAGMEIPRVAGRFHNTIADVVLEYAAAARDRTGLSDVCLSGGCFQNALLLEKSAAGLAAAGFAVHRHRLVPPNDGCVALGQLVVAAHTRQE
ncbi:MAG: carbamoyltransferase HypF [Planctomycetota bacterium]